MADKETLDDSRLKLTFEYYKQQREELMELGRQSVSITLQLLVLMATFAFGFWQISEADPQALRISPYERFYFKICIALLVFFLGVVGLLLNINLERLRTLHIQRARAARKEIPFLEEYAQVGTVTGKTYIYYYFICSIVIAAGVLLILLTVLQGPI